MKKNLLLLGTNDTFFFGIKKSIEENNKKYSLNYLKDNLIIKGSIKSLITKIKKISPHYVVICGGMSGGILFNIKYPEKILNYNLILYNKIFNALKKIKFKRLIYISASCIYPRGKKYKIKEKDFLTGELEKTSFNYSVSKIIGHAYCNSLNKDVVSIVPATIFGIKPNKKSEDLHVINSIIKKMSANNKKITLWGSGRPKREFLYIKDLVSAIFFIFENKVNDNLLNIGTSKDYSIKDLANKLKKILNFKGKIIWDKTKPDGSPRKLLDSTKIYSYGWRPTYSLHKALCEIYK